MMKISKTILSYHQGLIRMKKKRRKKLKKRKMEARIWKKKKKY